MPSDDAITAEEVHQGRVCPSCQAEVRKGDAIHLCGACGAASHIGCWRRDGCRSYFCLKDRRVEVRGAAAIRITRDEAERLPEDKLLPPTTAYPAGREGRYPKRTSRMAILSIPIGVLFSLILGGTIVAVIGGMDGGAGLLALLIAGLLGWFGSIILAALALGAIANNSTLRGKSVAVAAILLDIVLVFGVAAA
jgi:hypothetical protein